ncbi:MAG TPA: hypothetical protein VFN25_08340 [Dokdonella sp.]|uniref:hypothetical protein n=1 Tax=Dokdonella sp. TaxID=2291710 RepID=UPI002D7E1A2D|nr:hypothetical protein [Dokdonella sp.]HET9032900.1 hypothetical protein [Dokdonella sp.]
MILRKSEQMIPTTALLIFAVALLGMTGCGESASSAADAKPAQASAQVKPASSEEKADRGSARFSTKGTIWEGTRASARIKNDRLRISASRMDRIDDKMQRDQLNLNIGDYKGPGRYKVGMSSMFVRVSINMPKKEGEEVDAQKTLMDALGNTSNIRLANADIEITSVSGGYIDGTFSMETPAGMPDSTITDGQFHARIRE